MAFDYGWRPVPLVARPMAWGLAGATAGAAVGLVFAVVGLVGYTAGPRWLALAATGAALAAAFLNAAFGYCLGCEAYLLMRRATVRAD
jgi:hypothetical protein